MKAVYGEGSSNYCIQGRSYHSVSETKKSWISCQLSRGEMCLRPAVSEQSNVLIFYEVWASKEFRDWQTSEMACSGTG